MMHELTHKIICANRILMQMIPHFPSSLKVYMLHGIDHPGMLSATIALDSGKMRNV